MAFDKANPLGRQCVKGGKRGKETGLQCGMAAMSFATIDVVYLLICCQTKQNKSLARTVTVERAREGGREVAKGSPSYIASFGFSLQLRLQLQLEPQPLSSISFLSLCSFNSLSSSILSPNFNSAPPSASSSTKLTTTRTRKLAYGHHPPPAPL